MKLCDYGRKELDELIAKYNVAEGQYLLAKGALDEQAAQLRHYKNLIELTRQMIDERDGTYG